MSEQPTASEVVGGTNSPNESNDQIITSSTTALKKQSKDKIEEANPVETQSDKSSQPDDMNPADSPGDEESQGSLESSAAPNTESETRQERRSQSGRRKLHRKYEEYAEELKLRAARNALQNRKPRRRPAPNPDGGDKKRKKESKSKTFVDLKTRRIRLFESGFRDITRIIERLAKLDEYGHFWGPRFQGGDETQKRSKRDSKLGTISSLLDKHDVDEFVKTDDRLIAQRSSGEATAKKAVSKKRKRSGKASQASDDESTSSANGTQDTEDSPEVVRALTHVIDWEAFSNAFHEFINLARETFSPNSSSGKHNTGEEEHGEDDDEVGSPQHVANRLEKSGNDMILEKKNKYEEEAHQLGIDEKVTNLTRENKEPAMSKWQKVPYERRSYECLTTYVPAEGLSPEEAARVMDKLNVAPKLSMSPKLREQLLKHSDKTAKSSTAQHEVSITANQWLVQEEMKEVKAWTAVIQQDQRKPFTDWEPLQLGKEVVERETWGIDCFTRRNIELVLETVDEQELRMAPGQVRWFLEGILPKAINAQDPLQAYDMRVALRSIRDYAHVELLALEEAAHVVTKTRRQSKKSPREVVLEREAKRQRRMAPGTEIVGLKIRVFRPKLVLWKAGKITRYNSSNKKHLVRYDDSHEEWINLMKKRFILPTLDGQDIYNKDISPQVLLAGIEALLRAIEEWGSHCFAVHPKGFGVVANKRVEMGSLICNYIGELYPSWLWEEKEKSEDAKRRASGRIVLPDFWNMRLERPADSPGGYDLLYVDAARKGNFASRMSHSCQPNCGAMTAIVNGRYCIAMRALRQIEEGEELCIDYNCVTDSDEEFRLAICLCGNHSCRGSFLYTTGTQQHMQVVNKRHGVLHRLAFVYHASLAVEPDTSTALISKKSKKTAKKGGEASTKAPKSTSSKTRKARKPRTAPVRSSSRVAQLESLNTMKMDATKPSSITATTPTEQDSKKEMSLEKRSSPKSQVSLPPIEVINEMAVGFTGLPKEDRNRLYRAGLKSSVCQDLPVWLLRFAAKVLRFVELEEKHLLVLMWNAHLDKTAESGIAESADERKAAWQDCVSQAQGVAQQRVTNLVVALDRARHTMEERVAADLATGNSISSTTLTHSIENTKDGASAMSQTTESETLKHDAKNVGNNEDEIMKDVSLSAASDASSPSHSENARESKPVANNDAPKEVLCPWWVGDHCEAKWCGDDAADYPGWFKATVLGVHSEFEDGVPPSLNVVYDTGEMDRVIMSTSVVRRCKPQYKDINEKLGATDGLTVTTHQPPLTPLIAETTASMLAYSTSDSVAHRLVRAVEEAFDQCKFPIWDYVEVQSPSKSSFWWNFETRTQQLEKPNAYELSRVCKFVPHAVTKLKDCLVETLTPGGVDSAKEVLRSMREVLMKMPRLNGPDGERMEDYFQKAIDILTYLIHTNSFFVVGESTPLSSAWVKGQQQQQDSQQETDVAKDAGEHMQDETAGDGPKKANKKTQRNWDPRVPMSMRQQLMLKLRRDEEHLQERMKEESNMIAEFLEKRDPPVPGTVANAPAPTDRKQNLVYSWRQDRPPLVPLMPSPRTSPEGTTAALLSWLDQKCDGMDVFSMMGASWVPSIESAFVEPASVDLRGKWKSTHRDNVLRQLSSSSRAFDPWPRNAREQFPNRAPLTGVDPESWPPPLPPAILCGSPLFDAALDDNDDFVKQASTLTGQMADMQSKSLNRLQESISKASQQRIAALVADLKTFKRPKKKSLLELYPEDKKKAVPPQAPSKLSSTWIRCERGNCRKWRRIPIGSGLRHSANFVCFDLKGYDDLHAKCSIPQEEVQEDSFEIGVDALNLDEIVQGQIVDGFSTSLGKWRAAVVVATTYDYVQLHFLGYPETLNEWIPKNPDRSIVQAAPAGIHTRAQLGEDQVYVAMVPPGHKDVASVMSDMVQDVCRTASGASSTKPSPVWSYPEVSAFPRFLIHQRRLHQNAGEQVTFATILRKWEAMSKPQKKLWGKVARAKFSRVTPRTIARFEAAMPTLSSLSPGHTVLTPYGRGTIVHVISHTLVIVAVLPRPGMQMSTPFGNAIVLDHSTGRNLTHLQLSWGIISMSGLRNALPFFISTPTLPPDVQSAITRFRATGDYDALFTDEEKVKKMRTEPTIAAESPIGPVVIAPVKNPRGPPRAAVKPPNLSKEHEVLWDRLLQLKNTELRTLLTTMKLSMGGNKAARVERIFEHELKTGELTAQMRTTVQAVTQQGQPGTQTAQPLTQQGQTSLIAVQVQQPGTQTASGTRPVEGLIKQGQMTTVPTVQNLAFQSHAQGFPQLQQVTSSSQSLPSQDVAQSPNQLMALQAQIKAIQAQQLANKAKESKQDETKNVTAD